MEVEVEVEVEDGDGLREAKERCQWMKTGWEEQSGEERGKQEGKGWMRCASAE